jgi:ribonuclease HI
MAGHLGHDTNNSVELWGLIRGIQLASDLNLTHLIIEGDSKIIISLAAKIINGTDPEKITPSWCLLGPLNNLQALLCPSLTLITSHIRREANKVAEKLANEGVASQTRGYPYQCTTSSASQLLIQCREMALQDFPPRWGDIWRSCNTWHTCT